MTVDPTYPWIAILVRALGIFLAIVIVRSAVYRIKEGVFSIYGTDVYRKKNPLTFWSVIGVALIGAGWFVVLAIR